MNGDERRWLWASASAIVAAIGASSCCILPLVLGSLGGSAMVVAGALEWLRPYFLVAAGLLIGAAWYVISQRRTAESCEVRPSKLQRFVRPVLLASTVAVVGLAFFPAYAQVLANGDPAPELRAFEGSHRLVLHVEGMTCAACAVEITRSMESIPGVLDAGVDYEAEQAWAVVTGDVPTKLAEVTAAVERAGFRAQSANEQ
jgi:mercuric ion transport protein